MRRLDSIYLDTPKRLDRSGFKTGCMHRHFGLSTNTVLGVVNTQTYRTLDIIFEMKCDPHALLGASKLMVFMMQKHLWNGIRIAGFDLWMDPHQLSKHHHHHTQRSGVFCHSIKLWSPKADACIIGSDIDPKTFAIKVLNEFKTHGNDVFGHPLNNA